MKKIFTEKQKKNFLKKFKQGTLDECWEWQASTRSSGRGQFRLNKRIRNAHQLSYEYFIGEIPNGLSVLHKCDNGNCVNPNHLFLGTQRENIQDCIKKNRGFAGEKSSRAKLTNKQVIEIRNSLLATKKLVKIFGISQSTISSIKNFKTWKNL